MKKNHRKHRQASAEDQSFKNNHTWRTVREQPILEEQLISEEQWINAELLLHQLCMAQLSNEVLQPLRKSAGIMADLAVRTGNEYSHNHCKSVNSQSSERPICRQHIWAVDGPWPLRRSCCRAEELLPHAVVIRSRLVGSIPCPGPGPHVRPFCSGRRGVTTCFDTQRQPEACLQAAYLSRRAWLCRRSFSGQDSNACT